MPGQTVLTRTPCGARSLARHWAKLMFAAFDAEYGGSVGEPICPATEAMNTIVPRLRSTMPGATAWATLTMPSTFTFKHPRPVGRREVREREAELAGPDRGRVDEVIDRAERLPPSAAGRRRRRQVGHVHGKGAAARRAAFRSQTATRASSARNA